ncbi:hypothetical protein ROLI_021990 [Roseobacter fucihabitans]|uniref:ABC transporter ATP-binding protein n=1 Tax=Roseobacter fucihabitans TaxID=1537242 RepID=A0ABZ2BT14_9RHOB|nr:cyclic nucleotide-binding domain-containing protein [Roseobacter litoralis]MBC6966784.1 putative multidrug export ATP-binding/permease protein [Roseobacter litoralis]
MGVRSIEKSLFRYIWKHSKRDQLILLLFTSTLFPFLYLTLELPKRIINDAIGAQSSRVIVWGYELTQTGYLFFLCLLFLLCVLMHGLLKMRINTMKGVLSERMLRRLRFGLIARMLGFPKSYYRRTSQGEMVAMITGETEPMGGMMGDALTQPVLQAGQMMTILLFLFLQNLWFGLAAVALIPLQAWLIPKLQRQINLMNKERIQEIRQLAAMIGETAAGASDLRIHGGWRFRLAMMSDRLGRVFNIRLQIYQKKFFMKFINNFITQLTPFFFFSVGGYLVIQGAVSLGALVAALAAYKDLSSPWKELLTFYNQAQDMSLRWQIVTEKFAPNGAIDARLMEGVPDDMPRLNQRLSLDAIKVEDADGNTVLDNITLRFDAGSLVGIQASSEEDRRVLVEVLTRETLPVSGKVIIGDHDLSALHQGVIAARIGAASAHPLLFQGSLGDNTMMSVKQKPSGVLSSTAQIAAREAEAAGNSADPLNATWLNPELAGCTQEREVRNWWFSLLETMGQGGALYRRALDQKPSLEARTELHKALVSARPKVWAAVLEAGLERHVFRFDPALYNPALPVTGNLFFATMRKTLTQRELATQSDLFDVLHKLELEEGLLALSRDVVALLSQIFGTDGTEHPLFRKLGLDPEFYERSVQLLSAGARSDTSRLNRADRIMLMTLAAQITAEQIGPAFSDTMKQRILELRHSNGLAIQDRLSALFVPLNPQEIAPGLSLLENALYGKISDEAGARGDDLRGIVADVLEAEGMKPAVIDLIYDFPLALGGGNLPGVFTEPLALSRAAIKRPDILILDQMFTGFDPAIRLEVIEKLRKLLPETTMICLADRFDSPEQFDLFVEIHQGRMISAPQGEEKPQDSASKADLLRKVRALEATPMFSGLNRKQLRLLAFGAKWFDAAAGEVIFNQHDDPKDGAYVILTGRAQLYKLQDNSADEVVAQVEPGALVGELGVIRNVPRALSMRAQTDVTALRLGAEEFLAVIEHDAATSFKLLQVIAGYKT